MEALEDAYAVCVEKLLSGLKLIRHSEREFREYEDWLKAFVRDADAVGELLEAVKNRKDGSSPRA